MRNRAAVNRSVRILHKRIRIVGLFFLLWTCSHLLSAQFVPLADIDRLGSDYVAGAKNSGLVIGILTPDTLLVRGYGRISRRDPRPPDQHTLFETGALTQVFTTTLAMIESRRGAFRIEEPIRPFVDEQVALPDYQPVRCVEIVVPKAGQPPQRLRSCGPDPLAERVCIAFCDLASHTSGLPNSPSESFSWLPLLEIRETGEPCLDFSREDLYRILGGIELNDAPGEKFRYSNLGIALLGHLVADIRETTYEELLLERLLRPLRLPDTRLQLNEEQRRRLAPGHDHRGRPVPAWPLAGMAPSCGLKSNARDLLAFVAANLATRDQELAAAFEAVQQPYVDVPFPGWERSTQAGYGWLVSLLSEESNLPVTWMAGGTSGHRSFAGFLKDKQIGVVVLANSTEPVTLLGFDVLDSLYDGEWK